jgi:hypothetical protein
MERATKISPRARRILEVAYTIDGVTAARVWLWDQHVAVGVYGHGVSQDELLRRTQRSMLPLQEPDETWDFGILEEHDA